MKLVTKIVVLTLSSAMSVSALAQSYPSKVKRRPTTQTLKAKAVTESPVSLDLRMQGLSVTTEDAKNIAGFGVTLNYNFYSTYNLGVEFSYLRPFTEIDNHISNGMEDSSIYLSDSSIWENKYYDMKLSGKIAGIIPSKDSQEASMIFGFQQGLTFEKGIGGRTKLSYSITGTEYYHKYSTAEGAEEDDEKVWNTQAMVSNRFAVSYELIRDLKATVAAGVRTYIDYSPQTYNIYFSTAALAYKFNGTASMDIGCRTFMKDPRYNATYGGPPTSTTLYDATGTVVYIGTTIHI